jgi:hypothetical protein
MTVEDIEFLEHSLGSFKEKYAELESIFPNDENQPKKKYIVAFDIAPMLNTVYEVKGQLSNIENFEFHAAIAILNCISHYKHFYSSRLKAKAMFIIHADTITEYTVYADILAKLELMVNFFPGLIYIQKIATQENMFSHIVYSTIQLLKTKYESTGLTTIVHVYSFTIVNTQLIFASDSKENRIIKLLPFKKKIYTKESIMSKVFANKEFYYRCPYKPELEVMLVPFGLYMNTLVKGPNPLFYTRGVKREERLGVIKNFINIHKGESDIDLYTHFKEENIDQKDQNVFMKYIQEYDYHLNKHVIDIVQQMIISWSSKIKDHDIQKDDEKIKLLAKHQLKINWLLY